MVLSGYCSYLILCCSGTRRYETRQNWEIDLTTLPKCNHETLHAFQPQAIQAIKNSELVDFNLPCSSLIVLSHCQFLKDVVLMIEKNYWSTSSGGFVA